MGPDLLFCIPKNKKQSPINTQKGGREGRESERGMGMGENQAP